MTNAGDGTVNVIDPNTNAVAGSPIPAAGNGYRRYLWWLKLKLS